MVNPLSNASYLLPPLVAVAVCLALVAIVWRKAHRSLGRGVFCGLLLSVGLWSFLTFGMRSSPDVNQAVLWERAHFVVGFAIYILYYHFTLIYSGAGRQRAILVAAYSLLVVTVALSSTDLLIREMRLEDYGYAPVLGPIAVPLCISGLPFLGVGIYNLLRRYGVSQSYEQRNRIVYLFIAPLFPVLGGFLDGFTNLPPALIWGNLLFCILCTVAIVRYHLLDIRIAFRKALPYLVASTLAAIPYVGVLLLLNQIVKARIEPWWIHALVIVLLAIGLRPLHSLAQQWVDRLFYRGRYNYLRALERFSHEAKNIININRLGSTLVRLISGALGSSSVCLLLPSEGDTSLAITSCVGLDNRSSGIVMRGNGLLVKWLRRHPDILSSEDLSIVPQLRGLSRAEKNKLEQMGIELYVPIEAREAELSGVLVLGEKLSQQPYSSEDKQLLTALSSQMAIALENARLYSDALRARENLETWLNSMSDCVMIVSTEYTVQFINKVAVENFGSVVGRTCWSTLGKNTKCANCPVPKYLGNNREGSHYFNNVGDRHYDVAAAPILNPDGSLAIIEVLRDVTEYKQAEEREKQLQQELNLSSRLAAIGELASGVAHEINNPLTGIMGFSQRLLRKSTGETSKRGLERIYEEAQRAAKVVENLRTFAHRKEPKKECLDIHDILQKALDMRIYELKTGNIEVITELAPALPPVMVDFHQIQQVFLNIVLNAEQAMTEANGGGRLIIKTEEKKGHVSITFTDDGPRIPHENLNKLFDPFFTTRGEKGGTGLGLSICHGIVTEHGGKIYARSKPGKGTTFSVELPIMSETADKNKVEKEEAIPRPHKHDLS